MSEKLDQATGVVTLALGWLTVALSPADALAWGDTLTQLAPFCLITFLIWRMRQLDSQLKEANRRCDDLTDELINIHKRLEGRD